MLLRVRVPDDDRLFDVDEDRTVAAELFLDEDPERTVAELFDVPGTLFRIPEDRVFPDELPETPRIARAASLAKVPWPDDREADLAGVLFTVSVALFTLLLIASTDLCCAVGIALPVEFSVLRFVVEECTLWRADVRFPDSPPLSSREEISGAGLLFRLLLLVPDELLEEDPLLFTVPLLLEVELLLFTVPLLLEVERLLFTVPLLLLPELLRFTVPRLELLPELPRFTVPRLVLLPELPRFTVPLLLVVERLRFTVPLDDSTCRVRLSVRTSERDLAALLLTFDADLVVRFRALLLERDESALVLGP